MSVPRRREGFPGQHHCVVPPAVVDVAGRSPLLRGLLATDAGFYPRAAGHYVARRVGAAGAVLLLCCAGRGWVRWRGRTEPLGPGDAALLPPGEPHAYGAADGEPWSIEWAHFAGVESAGWRELLLGDVGGCVVTIPAARVEDVRLAAVYEQLETGYGDLQLLAAAAALRGALTQLARLRQRAGAPARAADHLEEAAAWMREHLDQRITLADVARRACLSPSHCSAVFRRRYGYAPIDWLIRQRVQRACSLLQSRPDKVAVIARAVGVEDAFYFSRMFRRVMGVSPAQFRRG